MLKILLSFSFIVIISYFKSQNLSSSEFSISEIDDNIFVHFGVQEDSNKTNKGDIANIGFILQDTFNSKLNCIHITSNDNNN